MARVKSTVSVRKLIDDANKFFANSTCSPDSRAMVQMFVSHQLMDCNAYAGFGYINGYPCEDETRIFFYYNAQLKGDQR